MCVSLLPTEHLSRKGFPMKYTKQPTDSNRTENFIITAQFSLNVCLAHWQNFNRNIVLCVVISWRHSRHVGAQNKREKCLFDSIIMQNMGQLTCCSFVHQHIRLITRLKTTHATFWSKAVIVGQRKFFFRIILEKTENSLTVLTFFSHSLYNLWNTDHPKFSDSIQREVSHFTEYTKIVDLLKGYAKKSLKELQSRKFATASTDFGKFLISQAYRPW